MFLYLHLNLLWWNSGTPPWKATTCNMFWYNDLCRSFIDFPFVGISLDFSLCALWRNVLPQDFATSSFVISKIFGRSFFLAKGVAKLIATRIATKSSSTKPPRNHEECIHNMCSIHICVYVCECNALPCYAMQYDAMSVV